jgi:hypothetical protein
MATAMSLDAAPRSRSSRARTRQQPASTGIALVTPPAAGAEVYQALLEVMNRPAPPFRVQPAACTCVDCLPTHAAQFSCDTCGYRGTPFMHGCQCTPSGIHVMIEYYEDRLEIMRQRGVDCLPDGDTRARVEHTLDQLRDSLDFVRAGRPCLVRSAAPASPERTGQTDDCLHGFVECPCCGGGPACYDAESIDPWQRIREMRAVIECLTSGGNACFTLRMAD